MDIWNGTARNSDEKIIIGLIYKKVGIFYTVDNKVEEIEITAVEYRSIVVIFLKEGFKVSEQFVSLYNNFVISNGRIETYYMTSEIEHVDDENIMVIFRNNENRTVFNRFCKVKWLEMAMEGNLELARMEMGGNNV